MATSVLRSESTLTDRYQTTVPDMVRKALHLRKRDKIQYTVQADGHVLMSRASQSEDDSVLGQFLIFLAQDIKQNPQHVNAISADLVDRIQSLVSGVEIDLDRPLSEEDD
ncbi:MAG: type II toxin-antitoxin system PrlF family antitoxin [Gammaproteobacteria bacterium]